MVPNLRHTPHRGNLIFKAGNSRVSYQQWFFSNEPVCMGLFEYDSCSLEACIDQVNDLLGFLHVFFSYSNIIDIIEI